MDLNEQRTRAERIADRLAMIAWLLLIQFTVPVALYFYSSKLEGVSVFCALAILFGHRLPGVWRGDYRSVLMKSGLRSARRSVQQ